MNYKENTKGIEFRKERTLVFVDYEGWYYGLRNQYNNERPNFQEWFSEVRKKGSIEDVFIFGDFSQDGMRDEENKLRNITNNVISCTKSTNQKEFTDFIMLDHIYQKLIKQTDIAQFIIFSGDAHFQSVVAFLKNFREKMVGVYAIKGCMSELLKEASSWYVELEPADLRYDEYKGLIEENLRWVGGKTGLFPTFRKTCEVIWNKHFEILDYDFLQSVLSDLIARGLITKEDFELDSGRSITALVPQWDKWSKQNH